MTHRLGWMTWATGTVLLVAVSACGGAADTGPNSTSSPPSAISYSASAPSGSTPASPEDEATTAAVALMHRYFAVLDAVRQDPSKPVSALAAVATSIQRSALTRAIKNERADHERQTGTTILRRVVVQSVDLGNSSAQSRRVPTVSVDVCWDVTGVDLIDQSGESVVSPGRPDIGWIRYVAVNHDWATNPYGGWRVSDGTTLKKASCAS